MRGSFLRAAAEINKDLEAKLEERKKDYNDKNKGYKAVVDFESNNAVFQFMFQITENNNATSTGTITWPIDIGVITLGYGVGDKRQRMSDRQVRLVASFGELVQLVEPDKPDDPSCDDVEIPEEHRFPRRYPITGEIGLAEVIWDYMRVNKLKSGKFQAGGANNSYRDKITFTTAINGGLTPGLNLSKRMGQLIQADVDLTADRKDVHELIIFLTPPGAAPAASPQEVIIRQMPAVRVRSRSVEQSPAG